jgi:hypothetical protein
MQFRLETAKNFRKGRVSMTIRKPESISRRLDLTAESVERAKQGYSLKTLGSVTANLESIEFREMLDVAVEEFLPQLIAAFEQIRLKKPAGPISKRPRPVSIDTWTRLGDVADDYGVSRIQIIRCVLELLADQNGEKNKARARKK